MTKTERKVLVLLSELLQRHLNDQDALQHNVTEGDDIPRMMSLSELQVATDRLKAKTEA